MISASGLVPLRKKYFFQSSSIIGHSQNLIGKMDLLHTERLKNHFGQFYFTLKKIGIIRKTALLSQLECSRKKSSYNAEICEITLQRPANLVMYANRQGIEF